MSSSPASGPRWAVASLCDEPLPLLAAYAAHYIRMGASEVWLFLDTPDPAVEKAFAGLPEVRIVQCDDAFWESTGKPRFNNSQQRQLEIIHHAYHATRADWIAHLDCDEFLAGQSDMSALLAAQPDHVGALSFPVAERVLTAPHGQDDLFEGLFRHPLRDPDLAERVYGEDTRFLKHGLTGHALGKSIMRAGFAQGVIPGIHAPRLKAGVALETRDSDAFQLLHFDGLTALHWAAKLLRFCRSPHDMRRKRKYNACRFAQMEFVRDNLEGDFGGVMTLHERLKRLSPARQQALVKIGALSRFSPDIAGALAALKLRGVDASAQAFDDALIAADPGLTPALETYHASRAA